MVECSTFTGAVALNKAGTKKFNAKGESLIMVGYSQVSKAYRLYNKKNRSVVEKRDVVFNEDDFDDNFDSNENHQDIFTFYPQNSMEENHLLPYDQEDDCEFESADEEINGSTTVEKEQNAQNTGEREQMEPAGKTFGKNQGQLVQQSLENEQRILVNNSTKRVVAPRKLVEKSVEEEQIIVAETPTKRVLRPRKLPQKLNYLVEEIIPSSATEALNSSSGEMWLKAMQAELEALRKNETWKLVDKPKDVNIVGSRWVFALKKNEHGEVERYKARLVAKGYSQVYGVDYSETFSPVVRYSTIRMIISIAVKMGMYLHQIDIKSAYLHSEIHDDIYVQQPEMFIDKKYPNKVLKLQKALYGLKQSGREWFDKLGSILKKNGFVQCKYEQCLYQTTREESLILIAVYVDDIIIGCKDIKCINFVKDTLRTELEITDNGPLHYYLGIEVEREGKKGAISISQKQYIKDLLKNYDMENCKPVKTPLEANFQVGCSENVCNKINPQVYQSYIGALIYLATTTRPDILHSVSKLAQRNSDPHVDDMIAVKHILRYLRGTIELKLKYSCDGGSSLVGYADADWGGNSMDRKSYSGFIFFIGNCPVSWESRKQSCVALSSTEAEYVALSEASKEAVFLRNLLMEIGYSNGDAVVLHVDNQGAEKLATNPVYHKRTKHIDIRYHHVRDIVKNNEIVLKYCPTENMIADILTKNLAKIKHERFLKLMNLN